MPASSRPLSRPPIPLNKDSTLIASTPRRHWLRTPETDEDHPRRGPARGREDESSRVHQPRVDVGPHEVADGHPVGGGELAQGGVLPLGHPHPDHLGAGLGLRGQWLGALGAGVGFAVHKNHPSTICQVGSPGPILTKLVS